MKNQSGKSWNISAINFGLLSKRFEPTKKKTARKRIAAIRPIHFFPRLLSAWAARPTETFSPYPIAFERRETKYRLIINNISGAHTKLISTIIDTWQQNL